jgi:hypothetical protein
MSIITAILSWFGITLPGSENNTTNSSSVDEFPGRRRGGGI